MLTYLTESLYTPGLCLDYVNFPCFQYFPDPLASVLWFTERQRGEGKKISRPVGHSSLFCFRLPFTLITWLQKEQDLSLLDNCYSVFVLPCIVLGQAAVLGEHEAASCWRWDFSIKWCLLAAKLHVIKNTL